jgi:ring-1,2-phenylacetyl-CoA epoxidase subunit PaaC
VTEAARALLVALADDELVIGHRHSEWTGFAPHLEEDVAFSSIAQDEIGQAAALYELAARHEAVTADDLAFGRRPDEYRHAVLCERPNRDWAYTLARHWLYDHADAVRLEVLERSTDHELAALATKMRREERYHLLHADSWMRRVAHGPVEGRARVVAALTDAFGEAMSLFEPVEDEARSVTQGVLPETSQQMMGRFIGLAGDALDGFGLPTDIRASLDESAEFVASSSGDLIATHPPAPGREDGAHPRAVGGRRGSHSEVFERLWSEMTETYRLSPGATW